MVERFLRDFPLSRGMFEYEDYQSHPTRAAASEFIARAIEDNYDQIAKRESYVSYIAQRPRAERIGSHGLFNSSGDALSLSKVAEEVANHPGNVWFPIISLRREDAARLGFDSARQWQSFLASYAMEIAETMKIPWNQFCWYAFYHELYTQAAVRGFPYAAWELGKRYRDGVGCVPDEQQSARHFSMAYRGFRELVAQRPDDRLWYRIGWMLLHGVGTERNECAALNWLEKSAAYGNPYAQYQAAKQILADPAVDSAQTVNAVTWLTEAAEDGLDYAQYALGKLYRDGGAVEQNDLTAVIWFIQAAE